MISGIATVRLFPGDFVTVEAGAVRKVTREDEWKAGGRLIAISPCEPGHECQCAGQDEIFRMQE